MECEICEKEMVIHTETHDYFDPGTPNGHGQTETQIWLCLNCEYTQPYIKEDDEL